MTDNAITTAGAGRPERAETVLPERLDSKAAKDLSASLVTQMGRPLTVDAGRVQSLGALCAGILLSAAKTWKQAEVPFALAHPSPRFCKDLAQMGLTETCFEDI